ncbi:MAG TPA: CGNR zinc finger domain-containing protein [Steroidobacteraceae bacterium]
MPPDAPGTLFDLCGGHPALDLVNSLDNRFRQDGPNELLASYADLLRFLEESGLLRRQHVRVLSRARESEAALEALHSAHELREATAAVLYNSVDAREPRQQDIRMLEKHFLDAARHRELHWGDRGRGGLAWRWGRYENEPKLPVWALAESVSHILLSSNIARVRTCAADTCRWLFLDTSKNHTRRWCNMRVCGNRMKARRFQARRDQT